MFRSNKAAEPTIIGAGAVIEGIVRVSGRVQIDGRIEGTLEVEGEVSVGPKGVVDGELLGTTLVIGGKATGKITARNHLHVVSTGVVQGDVRYDTLQVDRGGLIGGNTVHAMEDEEEPAEEPANVRKLNSQAPPAVPSAANA